MVDLDDLTRSRWDAVVVGAGHNGLACAAYLARAGRTVLVLEARHRVGGACTLEEPWPGWRVSPCAYLLGLLHPLVIEELRLVERGLSWIPAAAGMFVPFEDGTSVQLWDEADPDLEEIRRLAPADVEGWRAMTALEARVRDALRPAGEGDVWVGEPPTRDELEARVGNDPDAVGLLFEWSMADLVDRHLTDGRLRDAILGQGVIGTNATPFDPGTAFVHFHHASGRLGGRPGGWAHVRGGIGTVSFLLRDAAVDAGAAIACGLPVGRIVPGEGVELEGGDRVQAPVVVSNADPVTTCRLIGDDADPAWRAQVDAVPIIGCTVKLNVVLAELPDFVARPGADRRHHRAQVNTPLTRGEWRDAFAAASNGELPARLWTELYFPTAVDPSIGPAGRHLMSVFAQYVPYSFAAGDWDSRRGEVADLALRSIARFCSNLPGAVVDMTVAGPPDIEAAVGLTGGHIFHGECLPQHMWDRRLPWRTPMPGVFLCGAGTHPGGSVIGMNGRNAAMAVLATL